MLRPSNRHALYLGAAVLVGLLLGGPFQNVAAQSEESTYRLAGAPRVWYRTVTSLQTPYGPFGCAVLFDQESPATAQATITPDRVAMDVLITLPGLAFLPCGVVHDACVADRVDAATFQGRCSSEGSRFTVRSVGPPVFPALGLDAALRLEFEIQNALVVDEFAWTYYRAAGVVAGSKDPTA